MVTISKRYAVISTSVGTKCYDIDNVLNTRQGTMLLINGIVLM